jgi:hypothetical protein
VLAFVNYATYKTQVFYQQRLHDQVEKELDEEVRHFDRQHPEHIYQEMTDDPSKNSWANPELSRQIGKASSLSSSSRPPSVASLSLPPPPSSAAAAPSSSSSSSR